MNFSHCSTSVSKLRDTDSENQFRKHAVVLIRKSYVVIVRYFGGLSEMQSRIMLRWKGRVIVYPPDWGSGDSLKVDKSVG